MSASGRTKQTRGAHRKGEEGCSYSRDSECITLVLIRQIMLGHESGAGYTAEGTDLIRIAIGKGEEAGIQVGQVTMIAN